MGLPGKTGTGDGAARDSLDDLARRTLAGDSGARRMLVKLLTPVIQRCVTVTLRDQVHGGLRACPSDLIEELAQEAFLKILANDHAVLRAWAEEPRPLIPYLWGVARHLVLDHLRTRAKNPPNVPLPADPRRYEDWEDPVASLEAADCERVVLARLVEGLGERGLAVLDLSRRGLTTREIAVEARMTEGAVLTQRSRITAEARRILGLGRSRGRR
jgi:RNA polymerase sigma factor (sigma-70 family)